MRGIGGNLTAEIQVKTGTIKNEIGEKVPTWETVQTIKGWLDYMSGETKYTSFSAKIEESSHVFISDYQEIDSRVKSENSRMVINGGVYDIVLIDNPMMMNQQWEIYLRFTGGAE